MEFSILALFSLVADVIEEQRKYGSSHYKVVNEPRFEPVTFHNTGMILSSDIAREIPCMRSCVIGHILILP